MARLFAPPSALSVILALAVAAGPVACLGANASEDRQLAEMRKEISDVQSDGDKFEERLEHSSTPSADPRSSPPPRDVESRPLEPVAPSTRPPAPAPPAIATPDLPVVHVAPEAAEEPAVLSFTNANIGSALAAHSRGAARDAGAPTKDAR